MIFSNELIDSTLATLELEGLAYARKFLDDGVEMGWLSEEGRAEWLPRIAAWERFHAEADLPVE